MGLALNGPGVFPLKAGAGWEQGESFWRARAICGFAVRGLLEQCEQRWLKILGGGPPRLFAAEAPEPIHLLNYLLVSVGRIASPFDSRS